MTDREEALIILQNCLDYENGEKCIYPIFPIERYRKSLRTAIEALKTETKKCPICGNDLYEYCFMCCYEGKKVAKNER